VEDCSKLVPHHIIETTTTAKKSFLFAQLRVMKYSWFTNWLFIGQTLKTGEFFSLQNPSLLVPTYIFNYLFLFEIQSFIELQYLKPVCSRWMVSLKMQNGVNATGSNFNFLVEPLLHSCISFILHSKGNDLESWGCECEIASVLMFL